MKLIADDEDEEELGEWPQYDCDLSVQVRHCEMGFHTLLETEEEIEPLPTMFDVIKSWMVWEARE